MPPILTDMEPSRQDILLNKEEQNGPYMILEDLYDEFKIEDIQTRLWELTETALSESDIYNRPESRRKLLYWYKLLSRSMEAVYSIMRDRLTSARGISVPTEQQ